MDSAQTNTAWCQAQCRLTLRGVSELNFLETPKVTNAARSQTSRILTLFGVLPASVLSLQASPCLEIEYNFFVDIWVNYFNRDQHKRSQYPWKKEKNIWEVLMANAAYCKEEVKRQLQLVETTSCFFLWIIQKRSK